MFVSKFNASGNDFVILTKDQLGGWADLSGLAVKLCDRLSGVGADGMIVIKDYAQICVKNALFDSSNSVLTNQNSPKPSGQLDFAWDFYNQDGSRAQMCGNGSRAAAFFAFLNGICGKSAAFLTDAGVIKSSVEPQSQTQALVEVAFSKAVEVAKPFCKAGFKWFFFDTGVPHLVAFVEDLNAFDATLCKQMRDEFNANVNFARLTPQQLFVRTFERGVEGETGACGTGMAACFFASVVKKGAKESQIVLPTSGETLFFRLENGAQIYFKGKVTHTFDANFFI